MHITVVVDQPRHIRAAKKVLGKAVDQVRAANGPSVDLTFISATVLDIKDKPKIATIRADQATIQELLHEQQPRRILGMGVIALQQIKASHGKLKLDDLRGRMETMQFGGQDSQVVFTHTPTSVFMDPDQYTDILADFLKIVMQSEPLPPITRADVDIVSTYEPAEALRQLQRLHDQAYSRVSLDLETLGFDPHTDDTTQIGFGWWHEDRVQVLIVKEAAFTPEVIEAMFHATFRENGHTVMHNGKFDLRFLFKIMDEDRVPVGATIVDTMLLSHQLDERPVGRASHGAHKLKTLARVWYDEADYSHDIDAWQTSYVKGTLTQEEEDDFDWYHARDCYFTLKLWDDLGDQARQQGLLEFQRVTLSAISSATASLEYLGVPIDHTILVYELEAARIKAAALEDTLRKREHCPEKLSSADDLKAFIRDEIGYSLETTDEETIQELIETISSLAPSTGQYATDAIWLSDLIQWRRATKDVTAFLGPLLRHAKERGKNDWRVHPAFFLAGTVTGRISIHDPALQTYPGQSSKLKGRAATIKTVFRAPADMLWVEADYSQLELRVAAMLSGDKDMLASFEASEDLHRKVAATMYDKREEDITPAERFTAKAVDFGVLYGRTAWAVAEDINIKKVIREQGGHPPTLEEAEILIARFLDGFPTLGDWLIDQERNAKMFGEVLIGPGRKRRFVWRDNDKSSYTAQKQERARNNRARNSPIQGVASDITLDAMARLHQRLDDPKVGQVLFPVHDSINLLVSKQSFDAVAKIIHDIMETPPTWLDAKGVPLTIDIASGPSWAEAKE